MSVYLHDIPLNEAKALFESALADAQLWGILGQESIRLDVHALGRVLSEAIRAKVSSPHYHSAAMDRFVVRAGQTVGAQPSNPLVLPIGNQARYVDTDKCTGCGQCWSHCPATRFPSRREIYFGEKLINAKR